jgi:REP element-mobilizing transposase RayT
MPGLHRAARKSLKCPPILLSSEQAELVCAKFRETAAYRQWRLYAIAVMANHFHVVVEASAETCSSQILRDLKSYASRALTKK